MKPVKSAPRDVFIYFINGAKERAPAASMSLIEALHGQRAEAADREFDNFMTVPRSRPE